MAKNDINPNQLRNSQDFSAEVYDSHTTVALNEGHSNWYQNVESTDSLPKYQV